jgi:RNA polymerase sigma factor (sigma-70 family)
MALTQPEPASTEPRERDTVEELFEALESPLLSYALRLVGERSAAEDIVQESFVRLHNQFEQVRQPQRWLYRTVHNLALNHRRQALKIVPLDRDSDGDGPPARERPDPQPLPDEQIARWESIGLLRVSLETLDERSRNLVQLKFNEGLSYKEISARTGLTVGHVGYLLHHALKALANELARNGVVP